MIRVVRAGTLADLEAAVSALQNLVAVLDPDAARSCAGSGCCGCGRWAADVATPSNEAYCWRCVHRLNITDFVMFGADGLVS
jgi:hypothetical protein